MNEEEKGDCYMAAGKVALARFTDRTPSRMVDPKVVHGLVTLQVSPRIRTGHAWIEYTDRDTGIDFVLDRSNGREIRIPAVAYHRLGKIDESESVLYSFSEARKRMRDTGHYGPWGEACSPG